MQLVKDDAPAEESSLQKYHFSFFTFLASRLVVSWQKLMEDHDWLCTTDISRKLMVIQKITKTTADSSIQ